MLKIMTNEQLIWLAWNQIFDAVKTEGVLARCMSHVGDCVYEYRLNVSHLITTEQLVRHARGEPRTINP